MAFALRLALVAFIGTAVFASNAYAYYFPMLAGLCVALERVVAAQVAQTQAGPKLPQVRPALARPAPGRLGLPRTGQA
jgi:hypothetical protein